MTSEGYAVGVVAQRTVTHHATAAIVTVAFANDGAILEEEVGGTQAA